MGYRLLDLYCGAGGAAAGYFQAAGFDILGVDFKPQPRYPFAFLQADVLGLNPRFLSYFDAIHASPPCQGYTALRHAPGAKGAPRLIEETRRLLRSSGRPWVIENVAEAWREMSGALELCGTMFGLGAQGCDLHRHRLFQTNFTLPDPAHRHSEKPVIGVYGGHARKRSAKHGGRGTKDVWDGGHVAAAREAMGIDWMTLGEMSEAIPPAYTAWIAPFLVAEIERGKQAA